LRIAIEASTWINPRGYGRLTRELVRALLRAGSRHELTLVLDSGAADAPDLPDAPRVVVGTRQAVVEAASAAGSRSLADIWRMSIALSSRRFDAVVFPTNYAFVPIVPGRYVVVLIPDALPEAMPEILGSRKARWLWRLKNRAACGRANLLATISEASVAEIRARLPVKNREIVMLPAGISGTFTPTAAADDLALVRQAVGADVRYILYVGGLSPHKRVPELIRAFGVLAREPGLESLRLVIAGPGEADGFQSAGPQIDRAIAELGDARRRFVRTGFVPDATLAALYRCADCVVLPSIAEGFGLPALEAMASGTAVVAARNAALEEVCGNAAMYVDDMNDLARTLSEVLHDPERRETLRRAGVERARPFSWDEGARRLIAALDRAAVSRRRLFSAAGTSWA
jgi:glycosyltransferase involved in cell wall biosynthesis